MGIKAYSDFGALPLEMQQRIESELERDENLLWCGRQTTARRQVLATLPIALFGLVFGGFALFWIGMAVWMMGDAQPGDVPGFMRILFPLFGVPFLLIGLAMVTAPLWVSRRAAKTFYALTNKRAIVWQAGLAGGLNVRSFCGDDLQDMTRNEYSDGCGDLIFRESTTTTLSHHRGRSRRSVQQLGFFGIEDVRDVERQVRETLLADGPSSQG